MKFIAILALVFALMNGLKTVTVNVDNRVIAESPFLLQELVDFAKDSKIVDKLTDYTDEQEQWMRKIEKALKTEENKFNIMENPLTCLQYLSKQSYQSPRQMYGEETGSLVSINDFLEKFAESLASDKDLQASAKGDYNNKRHLNIIVVFWITRSYRNRQSCYLSKLFLVIQDKKSICKVLQKKLNPYHTWILFGV